MRRPTRSPRLATLCLQGDTAASTKDNAARTWSNEATVLSHSTPGPRASVRITGAKQKRFRRNQRRGLVGLAPDLREHRSTFGARQVFLIWNLAPVEVLSVDTITANSAELLSTSSTAVVNARWR